MKVLAVAGSRRKNGNTAELIKRSLEPFIKEGFETEIIFPGELDIEGCRGCEGCAKTGRCVINDDMQAVYGKIEEADILIAGSPTYFYNVTSDMKKFIDRCYCLFSFDRDDRSVWISRLTKSRPEQTVPRLAGLFSICEQNSTEDMGYTPHIMKASFESFGYRIVFSQKVLHVFKAGEILESSDQLDEAFRNGEKLLKTWKLYS